MVHKKEARFYLLATLPPSAATVQVVDDGVFAPALGAPAAPADDQEAAAAAAATFLARKGSSQRRQRSGMLVKTSDSPTG